MQNFKISHKMWVVAISQISMVYLHPPHHDNAIPRSSRGQKSIIACTNGNFCPFSRLKRLLFSFANFKPCRIWMKILKPVNRMEIHLVTHNPIFSYQTNALHNFWLCTYSFQETWNVSSSQNPFSLSKGPWGINNCTQNTFFLLCTIWAPFTSLINLHNYFNLHACPSKKCLSWLSVPLPIPAVAHITKCP